MSQDNPRGFSNGPMFCEVSRSIPVEQDSKSVEEQQKTEAKVATIFNAFLEEPLSSITLFVEPTIEFLKKGIFRFLSSSYSSLDASRPWVCYWIVHGLHILGYQCTESEALHVVDFLNRCKDPKRGGYGGGPGQVSPILFHGRYFFGFSTDLSMF